MVSKTLTKDS